jgi:phenylacetate-coenzyme A ligase PaaK-like adenylate-forming protein
MKSNVPITPLEAWIADRIGAGSRPPGLKQCESIQSPRRTRCDAPDAPHALRERIEALQLQRLRETIRLARTKSAFYRQHLTDAAEDDCTRLSDLARFPFTTPEDIRRNPLQFLCVSQSEVKRVVTLQTSGTTGEPKRIYFTEEDQQATIDFFHYGMSTLAGPGDRVLILLPGERPGSVGDLLVEGLRRLGAEGIPHGPVRDPVRTLDIMERERVNALVGIPTQVLSLSRHGGGSVAPRSVLLSTDYVPDAIAHELQRIWGCDVYNHYGMTEMGFGGGVECRAHFGYHLRELDLYFEVVNPETGAPVPEGQVGEVVFTTLTRNGMPLIRYRTGDFSRFIPEQCPCGTVLKTLARVKGRIGAQIELGEGFTLTMADLDEALFPVPGLLGFSARVDGEGRMARLHIEIQSIDENRKILSDVQGALDVHPVIVAARKAGLLKTLSVAGRKSSPREATGASKRTISDCRHLTGASRRRLRRMQ